MSSYRSIALLTLALALTTLGATSPGAQPGRGSGAAISAPTPIDGVYHVTQTADELAAVDPTAVNPYRYGEGTLVFDRGWVRLTQKSDEASQWKAGTFTLRGDMLRMTWAASGGVPLGDGQSGEVHKLRSSLYRDQLTFWEVPGVLFELAGYTVKPWRRTADAPSVTFKTPASKLVGAWSNGLRVLEVSNGRFSLGKKAAKPARGNMYQVLGNAIRFTTSIGEFSEYTWKIEGGLLKLSHPPGNSLFPFWNGSLIRKPWHRVRR